MQLSSVFVLLLYVMSSMVDCTALYDSLRYFERINMQDIEHRITRRDISQPRHDRHLKFQFNGKKYCLNLQQNNEILAQNFKAVSVDANGHEHEIKNINKNSYYKGFVEDHNESTVNAHIEGDVITAEIVMRNDTIFIEPAEPHLHSNKTNMIVYKISDIIWNFTKPNSDGNFHQRNCDIRVPIDVNKTDEKEEHPFRSRRSANKIAITKNICKLILVADYDYFTNTGRGDKASTVNYMVQVISRVHDIYRTTDFTGVGKNIGFEVAKVIVHDSHTNDYSSTSTYNKKHNGPWNVDQLLTAFSRTKWSEYCLAHLFTYQDFDNGIIGLAYVASASTYEVGGICTRLYRDVVGHRYLNCGLSSNKNWGRRLLTAEADLVTAHELGHNFGSNHDPSNCQPSADNGGKYIMYAHSVSGEQKNNELFSSCSRAAIGQVLQSKKDACFSIQKYEQFCGNNIVEKDEQCDVGLLSVDDLCCTHSCKLKKPEYVCSDSNDPCCTNCMYASQKNVCRLESKFHCTGKTNCTGRSKECPEAPKLNDVPCGFSKGNCQSGKCVSLCQQRNMSSCPCSAGQHACKICCRSQDSKTSPCRALPKMLDETDGVPCNLEKEQGQCVHGVCKKNKPNVEDEFSSLLNDFSFDKFVRFMEANIVGTILTFSLLIWVPASVAVYYIDKRNVEENLFMQSWINPKSKTLLHNAAPGKLRLLFKKNVVAANKGPKSQYHIST